jgi:prophage tail gpP-like protein
MDEVTLTIGSRIYGGWTSVEISRSIETMAGSFQLSVSERFPGQQASQAIAPGDSCSVRLGSDTVITGWIDDARPSYSDTNHTISLSGRDKTGDLVDCSAINEPGQWRDQKLERIAQALAKPFGISVITETDTGTKFPSFSIDQGETVYEAIERLCRMRAVLATSSPQGNLVITRAGADRAATRLERGENILEASAVFSHLDRFQSYQVKGQQPGGDYLSSSAVAQVLGKAKDSKVRRHRPLLVLAEQASDQGSAKDRAAWEANIRAARGRRVSITVQGWRETSNGRLWSPNRIVEVSDDWLGVQRDMLITSVEYRYSDQGSFTLLEMMPPGAFDLRAEPDDTDEGGWLE